MGLRLPLIVAAVLSVIPAVAIGANEDGSAVAVLQGSRTLVPIRAVTTWLGADVSWDSAERQITIVRGDTTVEMQPDSTTASLNGEAVEIDEAPLILGGVTYVPARFVMESFDAEPDYDGRALAITGPRGRTMELRVAVRKDDWITYRGPWFDIDYPASFRPLGYDHAPNSDDYDEDGMRFGSPNGAVEFYVYSPLWSGDPAWPTVWPAETLFERNTNTESSGIEKKKIAWVTVMGPRDEYTRSWMEIRQPQLNVEYYLGIRYRSMVAYDRWSDEYERFRDSLVQYAD